MKAHRLFLAIPLPPPIVSAITRFQLAHDVPDVRWTHKEHLHITVHFFGAVEDEQIGELVECLEDATTGVAPFELEVKGLEFGPPNRSPRMVWLSFQPSREFRQLVEGIRMTVKKQMGLRSEAHAPSAHVTVARFNDPRKADDIHLKLFRRIQPVVLVDTLILFESDFREYTQLQRFTLGLL